MKVWKMFFPFHKGDFQVPCLVFEGLHLNLQQKKTPSNTSSLGLGCLVENSDFLRCSLGIFAFGDWQPELVTNVNVRKDLLVMGVCISP